MFQTVARPQPQPALPVVRHDRLRVRTLGCLQFVDLTEAVREAVARSGIRTGIVNVQSHHTTAAILVNEAEPLLLEDLRQTLERLAPSQDRYRHDDFAVRTVNLGPDEPANGHAHCKAALLRASETLNVAGGELELGRWQRVFLLELDAPRERTVSLVIVGA